ncbi:uncharacterized protein EI90DRAFT_3118442 [Cantharellus anzutake]|uniref:uncharacterized protein n=1 Tax=Cantharellus anzutake TaxID=1750568 RepID=UPI001903ECEE|nr:uncharacterized protein EI90DRAFT_3118442 [Cantharellus anzutake]KAF8337981.1 hypothetical protein EI90DRAFT_3118442 [Cantharellus anzutake]
MSRYSPVHDRWYPSVLQEDDVKSRISAEEHPLQSQEERPGHSDTPVTNADQLQSNETHSTRHRSPQHVSDRFGDEKGHHGFPTNPATPTSEAQGAIASTWAQIWNKDPLADSDEEEPDIGQKKNFEKRATILARLRKEDRTPGPSTESKRPNRHTS